MTFEKKIKGRTITTILVILSVLSSVYIYIGIKNQKNYRDWQIEKSNDIVSLEIQNLIYTNSALYKEKIKYFINNHQLKSLFSQQNTDELYKKVFPFYSILLSEDPFYFIINFYSDDNTELLSMDKGPQAKSSIAGNNSLVYVTNQRHISQSGFEFENNQLFYKIIEPVFYKNQYVGCVEFGIREDEIIQHVSKDYNVVIASIFNKEKLDKFNEKNFLNTIHDDKNYYRTNYKDNLFRRLISTDNRNIKAGIINVDEDYYYLDHIEIENFFSDEGFEGILVAKNITLLQNQYKVFVYKAIIIGIFILVLVYIALYFSFNTLLHRFFRLQESLDQKISEHTKEILDSNTELNQIFNTTGNSMRLIDKDFNILRVNRSFSSVSGISKEKAEGKKCYDIFPGPHCHTSECPLSRILEGEDRVELDIKKKNQKGKVIPGIVTCVSFKGQNGELIGIIEDFKDISQRVQALENLKKTEKQFSVFMDNLPVGVFIKDEESRFSYLNNYMDKLVSVRESLSKKPHELFDNSEYAKKMMEEDNKVLNGDIVVVEEELKDREGNNKFLWTHKFRFKGTDDKLKIGGITLDITKRKKMEHQLKILSNAIQHSPACVIITNLRGTIEFVNSSFTRITRYEPEDVLGKNIRLLRSDDEANKLFSDIIKTIKTGVDWFGEFQNKRKDGETYWELASISPVQNNHGQVTHFIMISEDITERKQNEKELIKAKEQAEEASRLKTAFLANLSHEIRTPMNAILGFSGLLLDEDLPYQERVKINSMINENSQTLLQLIDNVLDISKIQSGRIEVKKSRCQINELLIDLKNEFQQKVDNNSSKSIQLSISKGITENDYTVITDPAKLRQVLYNILDNAVKFTNKGFVEYGYTKVDESKLQFYVIDSGIGISDDEVDKIYEIFRQADNSFTREYGGTGIGLSIAKKIVEYLGGEIWVQSKKKQGTTIYFTLPIEPDEPKFENISDSTAISEKYDWKNKVLLVAEDIDMNYTFIQEALSPTKAKILWAKDGKEAVEMCLNNNIDLVLMDIRMPGMDGFEASKEIKKHKTQLKIIGQTAYIHDNEEAKCVEAGIDNYISKPINVDTLLDKIDKAFYIN